MRVIDPRARMTPFCLNHTRHFFLVDTTGRLSESMLAFMTVE